MGTNYYVATRTCTECGHSHRVHFMKSFHTWRGYPDGEDTPWGPIVTMADWRLAITERGLLIYDEYGDLHDAETILQRIDALPADVRRNQYDWDHAHPIGGVRTLCRLDPEGYTFSDSEFS